MSRATLTSPHANPVASRQPHASVARLRVPGAALLFAGALFLAAAQASAQEVRGRVVDDTNRQPVARAPVTLLRGDVTIAQTVTGEDGFFRFDLPPAGEYTVRITTAGFVEETRQVRVAEGQASVLLPAFTLKSQVVQLEAVDVVTTRVRAGEDAVSFPTAPRAARVAGAQLARLEEMSASPESVLRQLSGLRIRTYRPNPNRQPITCIESTRRIMSLGSGGGNSPCQNVAVYVNGLISDNGDFFVRNIRLSDYESIEFLSPANAGQRFGLEGSANGVLLLWTRGSGPHRTDDRNPRR
jgi:hypothetical protein